MPLPASPLSADLQVLIDACNPSTDRADAGNQGVSNAKRFSVLLSGMFMVQMMFPGWLQTHNPGILHRVSDWLRVLQLPQRGHSQTKDQHESEHQNGKSGMNRCSDFEDVHDVMPDLDIWLFTIVPGGFGGPPGLQPGREWLDCALEAAIAEDIVRRASPPYAPLTDSESDPAVRHYHFVWELIMCFEFWAAAEAPVTREAAAREAAAREAVSLGRFSMDEPRATEPLVQTALPSSSDLPGSMSAATASFISGSLHRLRRYAATLFRRLDAQYVRNEAQCRRYPNVCGDYLVHRGIHLLMVSKLEGAPLGLAYHPLLREMGSALVRFVFPVLKELPMPLDIEGVDSAGELLWLLESMVMRQVMDAPMLVASRSTAPCTVNVLDILEATDVHTHAHARAFVLIVWHRSARPRRRLLQ